MLFSSVGKIDEIEAGEHLALMSEMHEGGGLRPGRLAAWRGSRAGNCMRA